MAVGRYRVTIVSQPPAIEVEGDSWDDVVEKACRMIGYAGFEHFATASLTAIDREDVSPHSETAA